MERLWKEREETVEGANIRTKIGQTIRLQNSLMSKEQLIKKNTNRLTLEQRQELARNSIHRWHKESSPEILQQFYDARYKKIALSMATRGAFRMNNGRMTYKGFFTPRNPTKYVGNIKTIVYRSMWEKRVMYWIDESPATISWSSEELKIPYFDPVKQKQRTYYPDFLTKVQTKTGIKVFIIEIKPFNDTVLRQSKRRSQKLLQEAAIVATNQAKFAAATIFAKDQGWEFLVLTERDLPFL
jgi:hypothetical protein